VKAWSPWLEQYAAGIESDRVAWPDDGQDIDIQRENAMKEVNPRFVLRQWVLEETIKICEGDDAEKGRAVLSKVLEMSSNPFRSWGGEEDARDESELSDEEREERRFCTLGSKDMLGFQCSCSS